MVDDEIFTLQIFTPVGKVLEDKASQVTLPSSNGEVGVLPHHSKYTSLLGTGILEYYSVQKKQSIRLVISGGFCSYSSEGNLMLLADSVAERDTVDRDSYAAKRGELQESLKDTDTQTLAWQNAQQELHKIEAIDRLISH